MEEIITFSKNEFSDCDCDDWKDYIDALQISVAIMANVHNKMYKARPFQYCPWCGKERNKL